MNGLRKAGSIAAIVHSAAYLFGIAMYFAVLAPILAMEPHVYLQNLGQYQAVLYIWIFVAYWCSGFSLIIVVLAVFNRLQGWKNWVLQLSSVLGLIWAALIIGSGNLMLHNFMQLAGQSGLSAEGARLLTLSLSLVENGLVSGNEFIGGLWVSFLCIFALRNGQLQKALNVFGILIGLAGVLSIIPPLSEGGITAFGFLMIPWFIWLGVVLMRRTRTGE